MYQILVYLTPKIPHVLPFTNVLSQGKFIYLYTIRVR